MKKQQESKVLMDSEYTIQCQVVKYLEAQYPNVLFTASTGGMRTSIGTAKKMKKMGYRAGYPDLMIFELQFFGYKAISHGLFIELKREKNSSVSANQKEWLKELNHRGYKAVVCKGFNEAKQVIDEYLKGG